MRMNIITLILFSLMVACGTDNQSAEVKSVRDQYRMLGMIETEDGQYEFRLCNSVLTSFSAKSMQDNCINPLVDAEGNYRRFASIPNAENMSVLKIRNAAFAALMGVGLGAGLYVGTRFLKHGKVAKEIVGKVRLTTVNKRLNDAVKMNDYTLMKAFSDKKVYGVAPAVRKSAIKGIDEVYAKGEHLLSIERRSQLIKIFNGNTDTSIAKAGNDDITYDLASRAETLIKRGDLQPDSDFANAVQIWKKRNADISSLAKKELDGSFVVNEGLQKFLLESAHGFKATDEAYLKQLAILDEALDGRAYGYIRSGKRYVFNKFGEPEVLGIGAEDNAFKTISELAEEAGENKSSGLELKDRLNLQRDRQRKNLKHGIDKVKHNIVSDPADINSTRLADKIKNRFKNIFKSKTEAPAYDVNSVAKEIAETFEGGKLSRIYAPAKAQARIGQAAAIASATSFFFVPNLKRMRPSHAALEASKNWAAIVSDFNSSKEVSDLRLILKGLAQATNSHISTQVRIFGL